MNVCYCPLSLMGAYYFDPLGKNQKWRRIYGGGFSFLFCCLCMHYKSWRRVSQTICLFSSFGVALSLVHLSLLIRLGYNKIWVVRLGTYPFTFQKIEAAV
ncbi:hypothetical protein ACJX0J_027638 [Zea mays]